MKIKVALLGGGSFLLRAFDWLSKQEFVDKVDIISSPRHANETMEISGMGFHENVIKITKKSGNKAKNSFLVVEDLDDSRISRILQNVDIAFSFGAAWIFKQKHIDLCRNILNMHCTTLPQWRGGGGLSWQILAGENRSAVTFHRLESDVDAGDIVLSRPFIFPEGLKTPKQRIKYMQDLSWSVFEELICDYVSNESLPEQRPQDESFSSYFPRLNSNVQACIDWRWTPSEIVKFVTAFDDPYPGAFSYLAGSKIKIFLKKASLLSGEYRFHPFQSGIIFRINSYGLHICATGGALLIKELFDEAGNSILNLPKVGDRIYTPQADLDKAMSSRFVYTPNGLKD